MDAAVTDNLSKEVSIMQISPATEADMESTVALWESCGLTHPANDPRADFRTALRTTNATVLLGREDDALVASAMVGFDGHRGWVYYLAVDPSRQRAGLGRAMMAAAEQWLKERGAPKLLLMVRDGNDAALGFYERLGLEKQANVVLGKRLDGR
jgi:ribosomal protein S18 acetylase RimI-like enzyme